MGIKSSNSQRGGKMKAIIKIATTILFISVFIMTYSCNQQRNEWKGTIEEVDGVTVVKNPKEPLYNSKEFSCELDLSMGKTSGGDEYNFLQIFSIYVDNEERIYVTDYKEANIKVFDKEGKLLRKIGGKGEGPGELSRPGTVFVTPKDEIVVLDSDRLSLNYYTIEGDFITSKSIGFSLYGPQIDSDGNAVGAVMTRNNEARVMELRKYDSDFNLLFIIGSVPLSPRKILRVGLPKIYWHVLKNDNVVYGVSENYEIKVIISDGKTKKKIIKEYDPVSITNDEKKQYEKNRPPGVKIEIPKYHTAFQRFLLDEKGNILVQTWEKIREGNGYFCDIFNSEGKYVTKIPLHFTPRIWRKNKLYSIEEDEEGFQVVKRYKVNWKI